MQPTISKNYFKKYFIFLIVFTGFSLPVFPQTTFWSVNFNNGCAAHCLATTYGGWTILDNDGGVTGGAPNIWYVSCAEEGIVPPGCGSSCIGDQSLHIGANAGAGGDMGASYNETGATNATYRTAVAPTISTVGRYTITLKFDFIAYGSSACSEDRAQLRLSTDNGATWPAGYQYCLNTVCCGACNGYSQGQWTTYTLALPAAFNNNPNVRIGFNWRNNGNGVGTDPSVAIDDIQLSVNNLPVSLISFNAIKQSNKILLNWTSASEIELKSYEIERSVESLGFQKIGAVLATGNQQTAATTYSFNDTQLFSRSVFYRLKMVDNDGKFNYSKVIRVAPPGIKDDLMVLAIEAGNSKLQFSVWAGYEMNSILTLYDMQGKKIAVLPVSFLKAGANDFNIITPKLAGGNYLLKIEGPQIGQLSPVSTTRKFLYIEK